MYIYVDVMYTGRVRPVSSVSASSGSSSSVGLRDLSWECALRALPPPLLAALRTELLDDLGMLCECPRADTLNTDEKLGGRRGAFGRSFVRTAHFFVMEFVYDVTFRFEGISAASLAGDVGTDPKTGCSGVGTTMGTDPKTGCSPVGTKDDVRGGDPRTDLALAVDTGADPRTGYLLVNAVKQDDDGESMAATCPPYRPGAVAPQTAISVSPALSPDTCLSHPLDPKRQTASKLPSRADCLNNATEEQRPDAVGWAPLVGQAR